MVRVMPIHKTGDKEQNENYRPISLTCVCWKLLEHIIHTYFEQNKIIFLNQYGFRQRLSAPTHLMETIYGFSKALSRKKRQLDAVCLDFSKAFDRVVNSVVISKLTRMAVKLNLVELICTYLSGRELHMKINHVKSGTITIRSGVPQGCVLGPVLFLAYINDISSAISGGITVLFYADDCLIYHGNNDVNGQKSLSDALTAIKTLILKSGR